jgi:hypothetical protein
MANKKIVRRTHHRAAKAKVARRSSETLVYVQGWMFVVAFALMLGIGAIVGTFFNRIMSENVPSVAGVQTEMIR